jgi:hypothetical protein
MSAVIVLGGHRCGTSAIAGAIAHLDIPAALPGDEIGASPSNPRGHFEDRTLVRLHQRMLGRGRWCDPRPPISLPSDLLAQYDTHLRRRAAASERWSIKDPRLCVLLPSLLNRLHCLEIAPAVVSVTRDPQAAADSLRRRHRMLPADARAIAWLYEGARRAQIAWLVSQTSIPVLQLEYVQVLADRDAAVATLARFLDVQPTSAAVEFLDPQLCHG